MGIYVHIPFCRSKCFYCGFYSVASVTQKDKYIEALCREIELRKDYLKSSDVNTLYFGGGTPSFIGLDDMYKITDKLYNTYHLCENAEITIEMNPEDVCREKMTGLKHMGFNRISIGVQSFNNDILKSINRTHPGEKAIEAIETTHAMGFDNIGIDLIIGLPGQGIEELQSDLNKIKSLPVSHVSVYILSIDPNSVFDVLRKNGKFQPESEDILAEKYQMVCNYLKDCGFEHYEISNFAKDRKYSKHNNAYWQQVEYIGLGPSAHSYNGDSRQWNIADINKYINSLNNDILNFDREELTYVDKYNEYLMTRLRTMWGADMDFLEKKYPDVIRQSSEKIRQYVDQGLGSVVNHHFILNEKGWLISDRILSELFAAE